ncbi:MAG: helix-turn-helix domain-containing protein [Oscillospiraceae bacterium]|nr:helix-turn-helix domain-containing protein [Oscillospiraceae bacterium]
MDWMTTKEAAELWGVTTRQVQLLCDRGRVEGAVKLGDIWVIPKGTLKPADGRRKNGRRRKDEEQ